MEQERSPFDPLAQQTFSPELVPMYQLSKQEYQAVVMGLSNLMVAIVQELQTQGQTDLGCFCITPRKGALRNKVKLS